MAIERVRPVNGVDDGLAALIGGKGGGDAVLPEPARTLAMEWAAADIGPDRSLHLARALVGAGLRAAGAAALLGTVARLGHGRPDQRAAVLEELADLERGAGCFRLASGHLRAARRLRRLAPDDDEAPVCTHDRLRVVDVHNDPAGFATLAESCPVSNLRCDPLRDPVTVKPETLCPAFPELAGHGEDFSFFVVDDADRPLIRVECDVLGWRHLGCRETAVCLTPLPGVGADADAQVLALRQLHLFAGWAGCPSVMIETRDDYPLAPGAMTWLGDMAAQRRRVELASVGLDRPEALILGAYRKGHRHAVRWGLGHLDIRRHDNPEGDAIATCLGVFHGAGRAQALTHDGLAHALEQGRKTLYLGWLDKVAVTAVLASHHGTVSYYAAGASLPGQTGPLSHALVHRAVVDAKAAGRRDFSLGCLHRDAEWGDKWRSIAHFKRGFASHLVAGTWFIVPA